MPRQVDHAARREELAAALWQVVRRDGIAAVSVRTVAAAAGTSPSALRHYFATQEELRGFALEAVVSRVRRRLEPVLPTLQGRPGAERLLAELLPLDADRAEEMEVYLAFLDRARSSARLAEIRDATRAATLAAVRHAVRLVADGGGLGSGREVELEADRLYPLVDGLAVHGTLWPHLYPGTHLRAVLAAHLDELAGPAPLPR